MHVYVWFLFSFIENNNNNNNNMAGDAVNFKMLQPHHYQIFCQIFNLLQRVLRLQEGSFSDFFFFIHIPFLKPERNNIMTKSPCPRLIFVRHGQTEWSRVVNILQEPIST